MALNRPTFKPSVAANRKAAKKKSVFWDLLPDTITRVRVVPPLTEDGIIYTKAVNHFGFKNDEGIGIAPACLNEHGDGDCFICELVEYLYSTGEKAAEKIAKRISAKTKWHIQGFVWDGVEYVGPHLIGLTKTTAEALNDIMDQQEQTDTPFFCDPDEGQDVAITRKGSQLSTKYSVNTAGKPCALDDIVPDWQEKVFTDVLGAIAPRILTPEAMREAAEREYGDEIDWEDFDSWRS